MKQDNMNFKAPIQQDDVFVTNEVKDLSKITGHSTRQGLENVIVSNGKIVNVVSKQYGHLPNEQFFLKVEEQLINADIKYIARSINRDDRSFAVDYILQDESYHINVKNGADKIKPMLRFTNSYDGSCKTSGSFGFFREVCANGLHVSTSNIGFSVKHKGDIIQVVLPEIRKTISQFLNNEFYSLHKKFEVLAEKPIYDVQDFVRITAEELNLFMFQSSKDNVDPSLNARIVIDNINSQAKLFEGQPNMWHGYNAFNEILHGKLKRTFDNQRQTDTKIFNTVYEMAN